MSLQYFKHLDFCKIHVLNLLLAPLICYLKAIQNKKETQNRQLLLFMGDVLSWLLISHTPGSFFSLSQ